MNTKKWNQWPEIFKSNTLNLWKIDNHINEFVFIPLFGLENVLWKEKNTQFSLIIALKLLEFTRYRVFMLAFIHCKWEFITFVGSWTLLGWIKTWFELKYLPECRMSSWCDKKWLSSETWNVKLTIWVMFLSDLNNHFIHKLYLAHAIFRTIWSHYIFLWTSRFSCLWSWKWWKLSRFQSAADELNECEHSEFVMSVKFIIQLTSI